MKKLSKISKIIGLVLLGLFIGKALTYPWRIAPAAFNISNENKILVSQAPIQKFKTWGTLEIPVPNRMEIKSNEGSKLDFDVFYFSAEKNTPSQLLIYVGHNPRSYKERAEGEVDPVSLRIMGKPVNGHRFHYNDRNIIEIITSGGKDGALLHIQLTEGEHKEVFAEMLNQMRIDSSGEDGEIG